MACDSFYGGTTVKEAGTHESMGTKKREAPCKQGERTYTCGKEARCTMERAPTLLHTWGRKLSLTHTKKESIRMNQSLNM